MHCYKGKKAMWPGLIKESIILRTLKHPKESSFSKDRGIFQNQNVTNTLFLLLLLFCPCLSGPKIPGFCCICLLLSWRTHIFQILLALITGAFILHTWNQERKWEIRVRFQLWSNQLLVLSRQGRIIQLSVNATYALAWDDTSLKRQLDRMALISDTSWLTYYCYYQVSIVT